MLIIVTYCNMTSQILIIFIFVLCRTTYFTRVLCGYKINIKKIKAFLLIPWNAGTVVHRLLDIFKSIFNVQRNIADLARERTIVYVASLAPDLNGNSPTPIQVSPRIATFSAIRWCINIYYLSIRYISDKYRIFYFLKKFDLKKNNILVFYIERVKWIMFIY